MTNAEFNAEIDALWAKTKAGELPRSERFVAIEELTDRYVRENGKRPEPGALDRLATLCLYEEITDPHPDKMARDEFPIMSDTQYEERLSDETSLVFAEEIGTDGRDYRPQTRLNTRKMRQITR